MTTRHDWDEPTTRTAVKGRSGGICEWCGAQRATDMHHRISRGVGGWWSPANILHLCREDHMEATDWPDWAKSLGLSLNSTDDPEAVSVRSPYRPEMYLTDDLIVTAGRKA